MILIPAHMYMWIFILMAVLPALILLIYIYRSDTVEKEPAGLLISLLFLGVAAAFLSIFLENIGSLLLNASTVDADTPLYTVLTAFLVVGVVEEGTKYVLMMLRTWRHPAFNFRFDGIVYSVFVSLGFAAMENLLYEISYGSGIMLQRALLAIPAHMGFAVVNGIFYGRAKNYANYGRHILCGINLILGYSFAVILHGLYDTCAMLNTGNSLIMFAVVVLIIYLIIFHVVKRESQTDYRIG